MSGLQNCQRDSMPPSTSSPTPHRSLLKCQPTGFQFESSPSLNMYERDKPQTTHAGTGAARLGNQSRVDPQDLKLLLLLCARSQLGISSYDDKYSPRSLEEKSYYPRERSCRSLLILAHGHSNHRMVDIRLGIWRSRVVHPAPERGKKMEGKRCTSLGCCEVS
jgi:hypothetical protein